MGGCVGYAGAVGPSDGSANKSNRGSVAATPGSVSFGSVSIGSSSLQSVSLTNPSHAAVVISNLSSSDAAFVPSGLTFPLNLAPGQSTAFHVGFQPRTTGDFRGTIAVASNTSGSATLIGVSGSGTQKQQPGVIAASTATLSLGSVVVGSAGTQPFSVTNTGGMTAILSSVSSSSAAFTASGPTFPMDIKPGQTVPFTVTFTPATAGNANGLITVGSNASNAPTTVAVSGAGTQKQQPGTLSASAANLNLGSVTVGKTATQSFTMTNTGGATAILSSASSSSKLFAASGPTFPMDIKPGQSVPFTVSFTPSASGTASATITVGSNASNAPTTVAVSGTGVTPTSAPTISSQPANQTVVAGQKATFSVTASGTDSLTYQWKKNGTAISGATSASYTTGATTSADNGASFTVAVSNSAGNVTSNAASLTVSAATLSLSAKPTSVSFGSVNVGSNSSQSVTFTNNGNSDVTVSKVTVSGAGFNATGVSAGQVVAAGKTASLSVTFAPSASGSLSGSVAVTSNAANSPLTVALSGTGASTAPPAVSGAPTCGKNNDTAIDVPTDWSTFVPPAKGQSYVDPTFGCTVTRVTDAASDDSNGSAFMPITMGYATVSPFNANDTYLMLEDGWNRHYVTDLVGNTIVPISNMQTENDGWMLWDTTEPGVFYYTSGNSLMKGTIAGSAVTTATVHQFSEYAAVNFMDETDVSQDGAHVVIVGGDNSGSSPENVFDYDFVTNLKGPVFTTDCSGAVNSPNNNCLHKLIQTPDNN
ncbi:MAG: choice-of-anchor D domain-containing protein, partial [Candidatus Acidiferrales bacterium]